jgi:hypothetical protein
VDLLRGEAKVEVPVEDIGRFESELLPKLRRRLRVTSTDGSYTPPTLADDLLVCDIVHHRGPALDVSWALDQAGLRRPVDDGPDESASKALGSAADVLWPFGGMVVATSAGLRPVDRRLNGMDAARFFTDILPALDRIDGLDVHQEGDAPDYREVTEGPTLHMGGSADGDWLDLAVTVTVDGEKVAFEQLFVALAEGASQMLLPSGAWFSLERDDLRRLAELISEARALHDAPRDGVRLSRFQASLWEDLSGLLPADDDISSWADGLRSLASQSPSPPVPLGLEAHQRPYQLDGYAWLASRYSQKVGAILADDIGLGKTLQALALICHVGETTGSREPQHANPDPLSVGADPFLVVAPTSVVSTWASEAARFTPGLKVVAVT